MLIHEFLEESARKTPDAPALWSNKVWSTYGEVNAAANQVACFLIDQGVKRGDRVAILLENSLNYVVVYYGALKCGAITVELNTDITDRDLALLLNDCGARILFTQKKYVRQISRVASQVKELQTLVSDQGDEQLFADGGIRYHQFRKILSEFSAETVQVRVIDLDLASIVYTSGSTGKPKGVVHSHLNVVTNTRSICEYLNLGPQDRIMAILPLFYVYGKSLLNTHFMVGGSVVLNNQFVFPNAVLECMQQTGCTGFAGVPSTFAILINKSAVRKFKFPALRYVTQAGGHMTIPLRKAVAEAFSPAGLYIMYGATEASARLSYLSPQDLPTHWGSIGKAIPNVELFVADQDGRPLPPGQEGEIVARGANIMVGYWNDPEETQKALRNGLYFTRDLGISDEKGYLYVVGRLRDMIKVGANRVSALEIEEKISEHPEILEVAVIGVEDEILGEAIKAFVVPRSNGNVITKAEVLSFCEAALPRFKVPKHIEVISALPKNASGKVLKDKLTIAD